MPQVDPGQRDAGGGVECGQEAIGEVHRQAQQAAVVAGHQAGVLQQQRKKQEQAQDGGQG